MTEFYFSPSTLSFIPKSWKTDGSYAKEHWPRDAVLLTEEEVQTFQGKNPPLGKLLAEDGGRPVWVDIAPLSKERVNELRAAAYADPITGSDRYIAEAYAERLEGNEEAAVEAERKISIRREEIKSLLPYPQE